MRPTRFGFVINSKTAASRQRSAHGPNACHSFLACKREAFPVSSNNEPTGHMIRHDIDGEGLTTFARFVVAGFAVIALVAAQLVLSAAIHGTNYSGGDGKLAQATILTAYRFASNAHSRGERCQMRGPGCGKPDREFVTRCSGFPAQARLRACFPTRYGQE